MTSIPEDIMEAAEKTFDIMCSSVPEAYGGRADSIRDIAQALLAERMKAAALVQKRFDLALTLGPFAATAIFEALPDAILNNKGEER